MRQVYVMCLSSLDIILQISALGCISLKGKIVLLHATGLLRDLVNGASLRSHGGAGWR